jgi:hypothetical protein
MENKKGDQIRDSNLTGMSTLIECINSMIRKGYTENFTVKNKKLFASSGAQSFSPEEINIVNFFRFEGASNPDDMAILYVIETENGLKGTLTDAYGTYSDAGVNDFVKAVESITKQTNKK